MAKLTAIVNEFDGNFPARDKYETKYFKYLESAGQGGVPLIEAFKTRNISSIENAVKELTDSIRNHIILIGLACVIIDRERLYVDAGYSSYFEYAKSLYEKTGLSPQSISAAKIIMERFIEYNAELKKYGFDLERNSNKLLYIEAALGNHKSRAEVFKRISSDTFRDFLSYARSGDTRRALPPPVPKMKIRGGKIIVDGKDFNKLPNNIKKTVEQDFSKIYNIRSAGNSAVIVAAYDEREARILKKKIESFTKEMRSKR
jgi:hypothetical protein